MTKTTEDKRLKEVKKVIEEWDTYPRETQIALESAISMARILTMIRDNEKAGQEVRNIDAKRHIRDEERLNQALNGKLPNFFEDLSEVLRKYNVDSMPEIAFDCCKYVLEEIHLRKINLPEYKL